MSSTTNKKALVIKVDQTTPGEFSRDSWWGFGPILIKGNDDSSMSVKFGDDDVQICPIQSNDFGNYWTGNLFGGKVFISHVSHPQWGEYARIKLSDSVKLPSSITDKINAGAPAGKSKFSKPAPAAKTPRGPVASPWKK